MRATASKSRVHKQERPELYTWLPGCGGFVGAAFVSAFGDELLEEEVGCFAGFEGFGEGCAEGLGAKDVC